MKPQIHLKSDVGDIIKKYSISAPNGNASLKEEVRSGQKYK